MLRTLVIVVVLAVVALVMIALARRRGITELSSQETGASPTKRDRPAGPDAESMDPEEYGDHESR
jgi:hypothetical protein